MFLESLESRSMMSASAFDAQVSIDQLHVRAALLKFHVDADVSTTTLTADCSALQLADLKKDAVLTPLFKLLRSEVKSMHQELAADRLAESSAVIKDESVVVAELSQFQSDSGNSAARKADRAKIRSDRAQLQQDEIAGLNSRLATRQAQAAALAADLTAITTAIGTDTGASVALQAAVNTFTTERAAALAQFQTDLQSIIAARMQLATDLTASATATA